MIIENAATVQARFGRDLRVTELYRMTKAQLVPLWHATYGANVIWAVTPPERWSKDELINDILAAEFPS